MKKFYALATAVAASLAVLTFSGARAADEAPKDPRLADLETQLAIEKARNDLLAQRFPTVEGGKAGTISAGEGGLYPLGAWNQVYDRLDSAAGEVCDAATPHAKGPTFTLVSEAQVADEVAYRLARLELDGVMAAYTALEQMQGPKAAGEKSVLGVAAAVIPSLVSFARLFRTDRTLHQEAVEVPTALLIDLVRQRCSVKKISVRTPFPKDLIYGLLQQSRFWKDLGDQSVRRLEVVKWAEASKNDAFKAAATAYVTRLDALVTGISKPGDDKGDASLVRVIHGEAIAAAIEQPSGQLLIVDILKQGGSSMVTSSFWRSDRLYISGGAIVGWRIVGDSTTVASGVVRKVELKFVRVPLE